GKSAILGRRVELSAQHALGTTFPIELTVTRVVGSAPPVFTAVIRDLTAQQKAEEERAQLGRRYQLLLDSTAEAIYGLDSEGRCTFANPAAQALFGYSQTQLLGQRMHDLMHHSYGDGSPF